ncbi:hypothetical protein SARC_15053, partial [Sphaeroforma arctica JP610]
MRSVTTEIDRDAEVDLYSPRMTCVDVNVNVPTQPHEHEVQAMNTTGSLNATESAGGDTNNGRQRDDPAKTSVRIRSESYHETTRVASGNGADYMRTNGGQKHTGTGHRDEHAPADDIRGQAQDETNLRPREAQHGHRAAAAPVLRHARASDMQDTGQAQADAAHIRTHTHVHVHEHETDRSLIRRHRRDNSQTGNLEDVKTDTLGVDTHTPTHTGGCISVSAREGVLWVSCEGWMEVDGDVGKVVGRHTGGNPRRVSTEAGTQDTRVHAYGHARNRAAEAEHTEGVDSASQCQAQMRSCVLEATCDGCGVCGGAGASCAAMCDDE